MKRTIIIIAMALLSIQSITFAQSKGYEKSIEFNGGIPLDDGSKFSFGVSMINGYRVNKHFMFGILTGYEYFNALYYTSYDKYKDWYRSYEVKNLLKIGARAKANFSKGSISPFFCFDIGYGIQVARSENYTATGLYIEPAFGVDFGLNNT